MIPKFLLWFKALSNIGKVGVIASSATVLGVASNSVAPTATPQPPSTPPAVVEQKDKKTKETVTEIKDIPYSSTTEDDNSKAKGTTSIKVAGVNGKKTIYYEVTYVNGKETERVKKSEEITTEPINEVKTIGTYVKPPSSSPPSNNCDPNYTPCVPNVSYDLDCGDIGFSVRVIGSDPHRFDRDKDGYGCESY